MPSSATWVESRDGYALQVYFDVDAVGPSRSDMVDVNAIDLQLQAALAPLGSSAYDGWEIGPDGLAFYFVGDDAHALWEEAWPVLIDLPSFTFSHADLYDGNDKTTLSTFGALGPA